MGDVARATKADSEVMKAIVIMTVSYLPATFVAVIQVHHLHFIPYKPFISVPTPTY